jgi:hypothetical protein
MKVLDLRCRHGHAFEGWFGSEQDYASQKERSLLLCPVCGDAEVDRLPSAPRLNLSGAREPAEPAKQGAPAGAAPSPPVPASASSDSQGVAAELQAAWMKVAQAVLSQTEDVGERFSEEARRIHYGEVPERGIRGQATPEQRAELAEEGIETMSLPLPAALVGPKH